MNKRLFAMALAALLALPMAARVERPRLVVGVMVDQMRWDYLYYYYDQFAPGGLRRLVDEGYSFEDTRINYVPTVTAIGHSSVWTGSVPALTGIAGNNFYEDGQKMYVCTDTSVQSVGSNNKEGQMSPHRLLATTVGDQLKMATDGRAKVVGVAIKDRAAILPAGHAADAAYWYDKTAGRFVTSTYYMTQMPDWAETAARRLAVKPGTNLIMMPEGVTKTMDMAMAAVDGEQLGRDSVTDLLAISISSTDAIGHTYGTRGEENQAVYRELDRQMARLLTFLDERVGRGEYLLFLTADHGAAHNPGVLRSRRIPAGGTELWNALPAINAELSAELGVDGKLIMGEDANRIYLDHKLIAKAGLDMDRVKAAARAKLERRPHTLWVVDYERALTTTMPQLLREMVANGYNRRRSGDLYVINDANWEDTSAAADYRGTTHGMWNPYDSHIPFVLLGWHVPHGQSTEPARIVDIAPTICAMLHVQMPDACVGVAKEVGK